MFCNNVIAGVSELIFIVLNFTALMLLAVALRQGHKRAINLKEDPKLVVNLLLRAKSKTHSTSSSSEFKRISFDASVLVSSIMTITTVGLVKKMLPKTYNHRKEVSSEIVTVISQYKHLQPVVDRFVFNDGTVKKLISLVGTVAVLYQEESYPRTPPVCYVKPTKEMVIIPSRHVNSNGQILLPYLDEWRHTQCDLHGLIQVIMAVFGETPPLCMRPGLGAETQRISQTSSTRHNSHITLQREDGVPFQGNNETNC
ncbi:tumor susceptibility gene 101 protein isoform X2 [Pygocentrus nattereri]|uniref:tumor susceptibility gene 101 protein isoform X2 n=1 Tax=Pygocentrus nattereri TaxID=42514 RepID=UPI001891E361|nr:tumor susceptibility gene 101 protein isoform X2 [Pygocentrus nattereri]